MPAPRSTSWRGATWSTRPCTSCSRPRSASSTTRWSWWRWRGRNWPMWTSGGGCVTWCRVMRRHRSLSFRLSTGSMTVSCLASIFCGAVFFFRRRIFFSSSTFFLSAQIFFFGSRYFWLAQLYFNLAKSCFFIDLLFYYKESHKISKVISSLQLRIILLHVHKSTKQVN